MTTLFSPQSKGCVHSRKKVAPLITTLFLTSIKGVCAFNEECGAPSPCFPIKGGGEPHFGFFTFWGGRNSCSSLSQPLLRHVFEFVRSSLLVCLRVRGARALRLLGVRVLVLGGRRSVLVFFGIRRLRLRLHVCLRVRCLLLD